MFYFKKPLLIKTAKSEKYKVWYNRNNIRRISKIVIGTLILLLHE